MKNATANSAKARQRRVLDMSGTGVSALVIAASLLSIPV
jgi:hypothetical protein